MKILFCEPYDFSLLNTSTEEFPIQNDAVVRDLSPPKVCQSTSAPLTCALTFNLMPQRDRRIQEALAKMMEFLDSS